VVIFASLNTLDHSAKSRLLVIITLVCCAAVHHPTATSASRATSQAEHGGDRIGEFLMQFNGEGHAADCVAYGRPQPCLSLDRDHRNSHPIVPL
jgi:hypothetical protein